MNEAELYILTNDLQFYNKLQELNLLDKVSELMDSYIEGEKESYEIGIQQLQGENDNLLIMEYELERENKSLQRQIDMLNVFLGDAYRERDKLKLEVK